MSIILILLIIITLSYGVPSFYSNNVVPQFKTSHINLNYKWQSFPPNGILMRQFLQKTLELLRNMKSHNAHQDRNFLKVIYYTTYINFLMMRCGSSKSFFLLIGILYEFLWSNFGNGVCIMYEASYYRI